MQSPIGAAVTTQGLSGESEMTLVNLIQQLWVEKTPEASDIGAELHEYKMNVYLTRRNNTRDILGANQRTPRNRAGQ